MLVVSCCVLLLLKNFCFRFASESILLFFGWAANAERSALIWRRFAAFKREERHSQAIQLREHAIESGLIGKCPGELRSAIFLMHNLQVLQPFLPALV